MCLTKNLRNRQRRSLPSSSNAMYSLVPTLNPEIDSEHHAPELLDLEGLTARNNNDQQHRQPSSSLVDSAPRPSSIARCYSPSLDIDILSEYNLLSNEPGGLYSSVYDRDNDNTMSHLDDADLSSIISDTLDRENSSNYESSNCDFTDLNIDVSDTQFSDYASIIDQSDFDSLETLNLDFPSADAGASHGGECFDGHLHQIDDHSTSFFETESNTINLDLPAPSSSSSLSPKELKKNSSSRVARLKRDKRLCNSSSMKNPTSVRKLSKEKKPNCVNKRLQCTPLGATLATSSLPRRQRRLVSELTPEELSRVRELNRVAARKHRELLKEKERAWQDRLEVANQRGDALKIERTSLVAELVMLKRVLRAKLLSVDNS